MADEPTPGVAKDPTARDAETAPEDRVPIGQKLAYAIGGGGEIITSHVIGVMVYRIFSFNLEMTAAAIGLVLMLFRLWDAFSDPLMGWISDNFRSRWGRRRPFILLGGVLGGCTFWLFWWAPRDASEAMLMGWMLVTGIIFFTSYTIWAMPYQSMLLEMTPDYNERTRVAKWRAIVQNVLGGVVGWFWTLTLLWDHPETGEPDSVTGMRYLGIVCSVLFTMMAILPAFFNKERYYGLVKDQRVPFFRGLKQTFGNYPFRLLVAITLFFILGTQLVEQLAQFLSLYYVYGGNEEGSAFLAGLGSTLWIIISVSCVVFYTWLSARIGKRKTFMIAMGMLALASLSKLVLFNPDYPWLMILQSFLYGPAYAGIWLMIPAISADIVDNDELKTGERREGNYASIFSNITKLAFSFGAFTAGLVVTLSGFVEEAQAAQADGVYTRMMLLAAFVPAAACGIAIWLLYKFPITAKSAAETRQQLEQRRGVY